MSKHPFDRLRGDAFKLFKRIANEIVEQNAKILEEADEIRAQPPPPGSEAPRSKTWLILGITLGVIIILAILIIWPIICCLKKRGAYSSEHVDEDIDLEDDEELQRSPKGQYAKSPGKPRALSPGVGGGGRMGSPMARSPMSPLPRAARTPLKREPQRRGLSPMGLSPMRNRSY